MTDKIEMSITLFDSFFPSKEITAMLNVVPSFNHEKGEINPAKVIPRQRTWSVLSKGEFEEVADQWSELKARFGDKWPLFIDICLKSRVSITLAVDAKNEIPGIIIPCDMAYDAWSLRAIIDIDCYQ